jgi:hypothetical protein
MIPGPSNAKLGFQDGVIHNHVALRALLRSSHSPPGLIPAKMNECLTSCTRKQKLSDSSEHEHTLGGCCPIAHGS